MESRYSNYGKVTTYTYSDRKVDTLTATGKYIHLQRQESTYTHSDRKVYTLTATGK